MKTSLINYTAGGLRLLIAKLFYSTVEGWAFLFSRYGASILIGAELSAFIASSGLGTFTAIATKSAVATALGRSAFVFIKGNFTPTRPLAASTKANTTNNNPSNIQGDVEGAIEGAAAALGSIWDWQPESGDDSGAWNILRQLVKTSLVLQEAEQYRIGQLLATPELQGHELVARLYYAYAVESKKEKKLRRVCGPLGSTGSSGVSTFSTDDDHKERGGGLKVQEPSIEALRGLRKYRALAFLAYEATNDATMATWLSGKGYTMVGARYTAEIVPAGCPAYYLAYSAAAKEVLLCVRGTFSPQDVFTDLLATGVAFTIQQKKQQQQQNDNKEGKGSGYIDASVAGDVTGSVHAGMEAAAGFLLDRFGDILESLHNAGNHITLVGHSLGAGVSALIALNLVLNRSLTSLHCYAFCPPACMDLPLAHACAPFVTSLVINDDVVPRLAPGPFAGLMEKLSGFDWRGVAGQEQEEVPTGLAVLKHLDALFGTSNNVNNNSKSSTTTTTNGDGDGLETKAGTPSGSEDKDTEEKETNAAAVEEVQKGGGEGSDNQVVATTKGGNKVHVAGYDPYTPGTLIYLTWEPDPASITTLLSTASQDDSSQSADKAGETSTPPPAVAAAAVGQPLAIRPRFTLIEPTDAELRCIQLSPTMLADHYIDTARVVNALNGVQME